MEVLVKNLVAKEPCYEILKSSGQKKNKFRLLQNCGILDKQSHPHSKTLRSRLKLFGNPP
ncbi:hypothetical protein [Helicobacter gastrocanis]|nr:hypothetical protein [Helicobacter sp. NHP19-003]